MPPSQPDVVVVGAGASGLMAGATAAARGLRTLVLERRSLPGQRLMVSAMGAGAVSNTGLEVSRFHGREARFVSDALQALPADDLRHWFAAAGAELHDLPHYGLVAPEGGGAAAVAALVDALHQAGGELRLDTIVRGARHSGDAIELDAGPSGLLQPRALVLATGGAHMPRLGGGTENFDLARSLGHTVSPLRPGQVPLRLFAPWLEDVTGLWMEVRLRLWDGARCVAESTGSMLLAKGVATGEAVFNLSRHCDRSGLELGICFFPEREPEQVDEWLFRTLGERTREPVARALDNIIPLSLATAFLRKLTIKRTARVQELSLLQRKRLLADMLDLRLPLAGTLGWQAAESTLGGVSVREVDPRTFASRKTPGLYLAGRMLDVAGDWGGFEQHFALASGFVAGRMVLA